MVARRGGARQGLLAPGEIPHDAYDKPAMRSLALSREELREARNHALRDFYMRPRTIWRTLRRCKSARELLNYLRYGWLQLKEFL